jgi:hypothetical protein
MLVAPNGKVLSLGGRGLCRHCLREASVNRSNDSDEFGQSPATELINWETQVIQGVFD